MSTNANTQIPFSIDYIEVPKHCYLYNSKKTLDASFSTSLKAYIAEHYTYLDNVEVLNKPINTKINGWNVHYWLFIFYSKKQPSFIRGYNFPNEELKYGYLLIFEIKDPSGNMYLAINKKNISIPDKIIGSYIDEIKQEEFVRIIINQKSILKKISLSNLDTSEFAIRRTSAEAKDIARSFSVLTASNKKINSLQAVNSNILYSIILGASRINEIGEELSVDDFTIWVIGLIKKIRSSLQPGLFIDNFAITESFSNHYNKLKAETILLTKYALLEKIEAHEVLKNAYKKDGSEIKTHLGFDNILDLLLQIENAFDVSNNKFEIPLKNKTSFICDLVVTQTKIDLDSRDLKSIYFKIKESGEMVNLLQYLNNSQQFIVSFVDSKWKYENKSLYQENYPVGRANEFKSLFKSVPSLNVTDSEKGDYLPQYIEFGNNSIFKKIVDAVSTDNNIQYLVCDDMGNEWADFIGLGSNNLIYYHAKSSKYSPNKFSTSDFHIVVSQALKNIGYMFAPQKIHGSKFTKWSGVMSGSNIAKIQKIPRSKVASDFSVLLKTYTYSSNTKRKIIIVVNFIRKHTIYNEIDSFVQDKGKKNNIQFMWLLSSLYNNCIERNIDLEIWCRN